MRRPRGFTLVELAIVITIIGLLIGGVLKGQELLQNARVTAVAADIKSYNAAVVTFLDLYKGKPGDFKSARDFLPGCTAAIQCVNGDGNGAIGAIRPAAWYVDADDFAITSETTQFWKHLALASLVKGIDTSATATQAFVTYPRMSIGNTMIVHTLSGNAPHTIDGDIYQFYGSNFATDHYTLTPVFALKMDLKMDDGFSLSGNDQSYSYNHSSGCGYMTGAQAPNGYNAAVTDVACTSIIKVED